MPDLLHESSDTLAEVEEPALEDVREAWAGAARTILIRVAKSYNATITHQKLADAVQDRTNLRTDQQMRHWIGDVLRRVADDCGDRGEPLLTSLTVDSRGSVGDGYAAAVDHARSEKVDDPDDHAARERLACYKQFGAALPSGGGLATLTAQVASARTRARKKANDERVIPICPVCFTAIPATGSCDNCG